MAVEASSTAMKETGSAQAKQNLCHFADIPQAKAWSALTNIATAVPDKLSFNFKWLNNKHHLLCGNRTQHTLHFETLFQNETVRNNVRRRAVRKK